MDEKAFKVLEPYGELAGLHLRKTELCFTKRVGTQGLRRRHMHQLSSQFRPEEVGGAVRRVNR